MEEKLICLEHSTCAGNLINDRCKITDLNNPHCEPTVVSALVDAYLAQCGKSCKSAHDCRQALYCTECYLGRCDNPAGLSLTAVVEKQFGEYPKLVDMPRSLPGDGRIRARMEQQQAELAGNTATQHAEAGKTEGGESDVHVDL
jgi:hypothetical protein